MNQQGKQPPYTPAASVPHPLPLFDLLISLLFAQWMWKHPSYTPTTPTIHIAFDSNAFVYLLSELNPLLSLFICLSLVCLINHQALRYTLLGKPRDTFQT